MLAFWQELDVSGKLTLKSIPDEVYQRLQISAETHGHSLNGDAIVWLESVLPPA
jgi:plasmid stability protein